MSAKEMPEWPDADDYLPLPSDPDSDRAWGRYEEARADYWEARCRLAVQALHEIDCAEQDLSKLDWNYAAAVREARETLAAIGELPPETKT